MRKKVYISPLIEVVKIDGGNILAGSLGRDTETFNVNSINEEDPPSESWLDSNKNMWGD